MTREDKRLLKTFRRVSHQEQADVYYVPFFTTIPFFLLSRVQSRTLYRVCLSHLIGRNVFVLVVLHGFLKIEERDGMLPENLILLHAGMVKRAEKDD